MTTVQEGEGEEQDEKAAARTTNQHEEEEFRAPAGVSSKRRMRTSMKQAPTSWNLQKMSSKGPSSQTLL